MKLGKTLAGAMVLAALVLSGCESEGKKEKDKGGETECVLTALLLEATSDDNGIWDGPGARKLWEDTGLKLEFYSNGNRSSKRLKQYMAAGTLPDLIGFETSQLRLLKDADLLLNLDEYQEELSDVFACPQYDRALLYCRENFGGEEKALYMLPVEVGEKAKDEYYWLPMLQWKPYYQAGCPEIRTLEDYLDVAEEMLRYKSTTILGERVYGFSLFSEWDAYTAQEAGDLSYLYGIDTGLVSPLMEMNVKSGDFSSVMREDSFYKRALHFYFEANQRGLLDPDSRTQTYDNLKRKYDKGRILFSNYSWLTRVYNEDEKNKGFEVNMYVPVVAQDMKIYKEPDNPTGNGWYFGVSSSCKDPEQACRLLNWLYSPQNIASLYRSPKDMEPFQSLGLSEVAAGVAGYTIWHRCVGEEEDSFVEEESIDSYLKGQDMVLAGSNAVNMLPELPTAIRNKCAQIGLEVRELSWDMIYAENEESFERLWNQLVAQAKTLGIDEVEEYYQSAWKKALEREKEYG